MLLSLQGHTALSLASMAGHTQVAKLLLLHGADVQAKDEDVGTFCCLHVPASCIILLTCTYAMQ